MWGTLGHWVGSPDLENAHLFGFWCSNPHAKNVQANGRFCLLAKGSKFSKGALRAVGAIAFVAAGGGTFHVRRRRCTSKLLLTARCAAQASLCCVCGSSAASTSAVQLEQPQASTRARAEEEEHRQESCTRCRVQLWNYSFPQFFLKENDNLDPSPRKIFACGAH